MQGLIERSKSAVTWSNAITVLPWLAVLAVVLVAAWSIPAILDEETRLKGGTAVHFLSADVLATCVQSKVGSAAKTSPEAANLAVNALKECVEVANTPPATFDDMVKARLDDLVKPRLDELKWMLTLIGTLAAFFVIAQSAAAFFTASVYTKGAQDGLAEIKAVQKEVYGRYPVFEYVEKLRRDSFNRLKEFNVANAWKENLYQELSIEQRQQLLSIESFASLDLHEGDNTPAEYADLLVTLARFYRHKFLYEEAVKGGAYADLERAVGYLEKALEMGFDPTAQNDLGALFVLCHQNLKTEPAMLGGVPEPWLDKAERALRRSLKIAPKQQRARYSLAAIQAEHRRTNFKVAAEELEECLTIQNWEKEPDADKSVLILYTLACYRARELTEAGAKPIPSAACTEVFKYLKQVKSQWRKGAVRLATLEQDFDAKKDEAFGPLLRDGAPDLAVALNALGDSLKGMATD